MTENVLKNVLHSIAKRLMMRVRSFSAVPNLERDPGLLETASKLFEKIRATIKVIPRSIMERGKAVVEIAVINDNRPDASLASNDTSKIYNDRDGKPYGVKGATSAFSLIQALGPPPLVIALPIPRNYADPTEEIQGQVQVDNP